MLLSSGTVGYLELEFWHAHEDRHLHRHDLAVTEVTAHRLAHRIARY